MMIKKLICLFYILILLASCSNAQKRKVEMLATAEKLVNYLNNADTSGIILLFDNSDNLRYKKNALQKDIRKFNLVKQKYGIPDKSKFIFLKGERGGNIILIPIMNTKDTDLNISKAELYIHFYPDELLTNPNKILNYALINTPLVKPERKLKLLEDSIFHKL